MWRWSAAGIDSNQESLITVVPFLGDCYHKNQVAGRGWTNESIADAINNPVKVGKNVNKYTGNSVTLYYVDDIHYVAVDDVTGKVIQVADLTRKKWKN